MIVKLLTEHHLEFLSLKGGCRGSSESTHVKMPHCWKSHVTAHISNYLPLLAQGHAYEMPDHVRRAHRCSQIFLFPVT